MGMCNSYGGHLSFQFPGDFFITVNLSAKVKGKNMYTSVYGTLKNRIPGISSVSCGMKFLKAPLCHFNGSLAHLRKTKSISNNLQ